MDTSELNNALKQRMPEMVAMLYPNATIKGDIAHLGSIKGEVGDSFNIFVAGSRIGCFVDRASSEDRGGTPLFLWSKAKDITFKEAVKAAKEWLGVKDDHNVSRYKPKVYQMPDIRGKGVKRVEINTPVMDYLEDVRRLSNEVIVNNKIADTDGGNVIVFPYFDDGEKAVHIKYLAIERDEKGKKH